VIVRLSGEANDMNSVLILGVTLALSAPALKDRPKKADQTIVGEWEVTSITLPGGRASASSGLRYTFSADGRWLIHRKGEELAGNRGYAMDPKAVPPAVELITGTAAANPARRLGIFKVERDTLTICAAKSRDARPTSFDPAAKDGVTLYVLERVKKKD
jgi:uncharacterized protein (TIGR03067 family)